MVDAELSNIITDALGMLAKLVSKSIYTPDCGLLMSLVELRKSEHALSAKVASAAPILEVKCPHMMFGRQCLPSGRWLLLGIDEQSGGHRSLPGHLTEIFTILKPSGSDFADDFS
jgi:hypothetical protein